MASGGAGFSAGISLAAFGDDGQPAARNNKRAPAATGTDVWWQSAQGPGLRLTFAGKFETAPGDLPAIGLLFTGTFSSNGAFNEFLAVYRPDGSQVPGRWQVSASPHLLYFQVPEAGKYIVHVRAGLSATGSKTLTTTLSGPVTIGDMDQAMQHSH